MPRMLCSCRGPRAQNYPYMISLPSTLRCSSLAGLVAHCQYLTPRNAACIPDRATETLKKLHKRLVLHTDVELRNWLWDEQRGSLMLVDFERAVREGFHQALSCTVSEGK